jgi:deoxyribonuclease-1-like protein
MKRRTAIILFVIICILVILIAALAIGYIFYLNDKSYNKNETYTVANWNLQIFGEKKANNTELMKTYATIMSNFDIIFIEEIRDKEGLAFPELCAMMPEYDCVNSSRAGRSSSKEQYGIIYLKRINLESLRDFNPDSLDRWERPPMRADFTIENYSISMYVIHTKPEDTPNELSKLEELVQDPKENTLILGDLNADCSYYKGGSFLNWHWTIGDAIDTTSGPSDCTYDRIILNDNAYDEFIDSGVYKKGISTDISDHYLVWARMKFIESRDEKSFGGFLASII